MNAQLPADIQAALNALEPAMQKAFEDAIAQVTSTAQVQAIEDAIRAGFYQQAYDLLRISDVTMGPLDMAIQQAYWTGGGLVVTGAPMKDPFGAVIIMGFNGRHPRAEDWARTAAGQLITAIVDDQRTGIQEFIRASVEAGQGPRSVALDIVGRLNRVTGKREGGIVGLSGGIGPDGKLYGQIAWVANARAELSDPKTAEQFIARLARDKRFDAMIRKAAADGKKLAAVDVDKIIGKYSARLLKLRGETIARTEALNALRAGRHEAWQQAIDKGQMQASDVIVEWSATMDKRTRHSHVLLDGHKVTFGKAFVSELGSRMEYPGDASHGAVAADVIQCFAPWTPILRAGITGAIRREYSGDLIELAFGGEVNLTVTSNHPILTGRGWVAAGELEEGDDLFETSIANLGMISPGLDVKAMISTSEQLYDAAEALGGVMRANRSIVNFHGDVPDQNVNVVSVSRSLGSADKTGSLDGLLQGIFANPDVAFGRFLADRVSILSNGVPSYDASSTMGSGSTGLALIGSIKSGGKPVPFGDASLFQPQIRQATVDCGAAYTDLLCDPVHREAISVEAGNLWQVLNAGNLTSFGGACSPGDAASPIGRAQSKFSKASADHAIGNTNGPTDRADAVKTRVGGAHGAVEFGPALAALFRKRELKSVSRFHYDGPVYNFESETSVLVASGIINHNCRCMGIYRRRRVTDANL